MPQNYTPEFKKKIVRLHEEEECQTSPETKEEYDYMKEMLKLRKENEELRKENHRKGGYYECFYKLQYIR